MKIPAGTTTPVVVNPAISEPFGVSVDNKGNIFVAEYPAVIQELPAAGGSLITIISYATNGPGSGVQALAAGSNGTIYALENVTQPAIDKITVGTYAITPALPAGLAFDTATGIISGTPTVLSPPTDYQVTAGNEAGNASATVNISVVNISPQIITFAAISPQTYGAADFDPGATSTNNSIPVTYSSSDPAVATIVGNKVHITGAGTVSITASQAGDLTHTAATDHSRPLTVRPAPLVITAQNQSRYYGEANPVLTFQYSGFVNSEDQTALSALPVAATTATTSSAVGSYPITLSGAAAANYAIRYIQGTLRVIVGSFTFAPLPVRKYGNADYDPGVTAAGVVYASSDTTVAQIVANKIHIKGAGAATITATALGLSKTHLLTVNKASLTIIAANKQKSAGEANPPLTVTYRGFVNADDSTALTQAPVIATTATTESPAGVYPITASGAAAANYTISYTDGKLTVRSVTSDAAIPEYAIASPDTRQPAYDGVQVNQGVSPNGDGINDFLVIDGIAAYPDNKLSIMSRSGELVFETTGYDNGTRVFDGHSSKTGKKQQAGTYFYSLEYKVGEVTKRKTGFIILKY
jgi:gliding motility-associated-like protein